MSPEAERYQGHVGACALCEHAPPHCAEGRRLLEAWGRAELEREAGSWGPDANQRIKFPLPAEITRGNLLWFTWRLPKTQVLN